jgi:hypothetical protein
LARIVEQRGLLNSAMSEEESRELKKHGGTGRPLGSAKLAPSFWIV